MTKSRGLRRPHFKDKAPKDPAIRRWGEFLPANRSFYMAYMRWLKDTSYSPSAQHLYGCAARQAIGFLDKPYWAIDPGIDLERVEQHFESRPLTPSTRACYHKGLAKLGEYLRMRCHKPRQEKRIHWEYYLNGLPDWLAADIQLYVAHCARSVSTRRAYEHARDLSGRVSAPLRWMAANFLLANPSDLTPEVWYAYADMRLEAGMSNTTVNGDLGVLHSLLHFLEEQGREICQRMLLVDHLYVGHPLPKDVPVSQLQSLLRAIQAEAASPDANLRRTGLMDMAWALLMLHSGLRTGEVRRLRPDEIDWEGRRLRIEQAKGLKDRYVYLSPAGVEAMQAYLAVRGPADHLPDEFFIFRHRALTRTYCFQRLQTYSERIGIKATPHQLRHSCATLLLNAGAPVLTVQMILGHKWVDTTLGYARLYDGTVAADYYGAMCGVEARLALPEDRLAPPPGVGELLAMVDSLRQGTLNAAQSELVQALRNGLAAFAQKEEAMKVVKVPAPVE